MFGCSPGSFHNNDAAIIVAKGYEKEENEKWTIACKGCGFDTVYYRPCRVKDLPISFKEGWRRVKK